MKKWGAVALALLTGLVLGGAAFAADKGKLDMYRAVVTGEQLTVISQAGFDLLEGTRQTAAGTEVSLILSPQERAQLRRLGIATTPVRDRHGRTSAQRAALQAVGGYNVWRDYDSANGFRAHMYALARANPHLIKLQVIGQTLNGREIIALKVTQAAREAPDGTRPAVLYMSVQHAREWIASEVNRRLLNHYVNRWRANDREIKNLLKERELWFVLVANPDGYQYTFDHERLWRKNLRDNDGDEQISNADGVDPNRNYPEHWGFDNEGSSSQWASQTYRGPSPGSERETQAVMRLMNRVPFKMVVNYHSFGPWILYPVGWQMGTASADDPIYTALSGTDAEPAVAGYDPGNSADELYVTNGETTDYASAIHGAMAWTPELGEGEPGAGFVFPDNEALVAAEFQKNIPFALDVAKSAANPSTPSSHLGNTVEPFYLELESVDPEKTLSDKGDFRFDYSYGDPQPVRVLAKRSLGAVSVKYQVNGGAVQTAPTSEWTGGERYGPEEARYFRVMQGFVTGTSPGDSVKVWFTGGGATSESFTYQAVNESSHDVLVLAAEDYTGASTAPAYPAGPRPFYLSMYAAALSANGIRFDVYDVDARGRKAPDDLGVLSHYDAVVWYTGNDAITREVTQGAGNVSRLANDEFLEVRAFLNEGGRLLYTGAFAGHQAAQGHGNQRFDAYANLPCTGAVSARCIPFGGSGDGVNDFLQYWLGAYLVNEGAGFDEDFNIFDVLGVGDPLSGDSFGVDGTNQFDTASFITTSGILPADEFPQFESWVAGRYDRPGGPFSPHTGSKYAYSQIADVAYKRLTREIAVPAGGATMSFWVSADTEHDWDYMFVEARTAGGDDWTTLEDANGHTSQSTGPDDPNGASCPAGWHDLHPHLAHYQTFDGVGACTPTGTTGEWWAFSGNSGGWQQWEVDLSEWAGKTVEVSIAYATDWSVQNLGVFLDDIVVSTGTGTTSFEDDGDPMDGWAVTGPAEGSAPNSNNWVRTDAAGFPEAAVVATPDSVYMGFGFEAIDGEDTRAHVLGDLVDYLLRP